jgi:hypothetical protein
MNQNENQNEGGGLFSDEYEAPKRENPYLKKNREKAYQRWLVERESHKKKVIDVEAHDEPVYEKKKVKVQDAWTETVDHPAEDGDDLYKPIYEDDPSKPIYENPDDPNSPITGYEQKIVGYEQKVVQEAWTETINHPAEYEVKKVKTGTKHVKEKWHWEYEPGYRDGDFSYDSD